MSRFASGLLFVSATSCLVGLTSLPARAQAQTAADTGDTLEEVVVTAEKRTENVQKTAISISTVSGEDMQKKADTELDSVLRNIPSLQLQSTAQGGALYIRGVGTNGDSNFIDPAIALSLDGVYSGRSERMSAELYDINRLEVLRGPQGTLYGRNADGGSVNVISNAPTLGGYDGRATAEYGNFDLLHLDAAQNIPVGDKVAFRVAALREDRHGYFTNDGYASHVGAFRVKGLYQPTDNLSFQALYDYSHESGHLATTVPVPGGPWLTDSSDPWYVDPTHPADTIDYKFETAALQVDYKMPWATLTVIPTFTHDTRYVLTNLVVGIDPRFNGALQSGNDGENQFTGEVHLSSPDGSPVKWVVGYYYLRTDNGGTFGGVAANNFTVNGVRENLYNTYSLGAPPTTSKAPFGQITYPLTDKFRITAGVRYTQDSKSQATRIVSVAVPGYDTGNLVIDNSYSATTYKAGVEYDVAPESMLYAQVSTGYKAGGFDTTAIPPKSYGPEHVRAYEIGSKNRFLGDTLQVNGAIYYYQYSDLQAQYSLTNACPVPNAYLPSGAIPCTVFQQYVANAGAGVNKGVEAEIRYRFTANDELDVSGTFTDAKYGDFSDPKLANLNGQPMASTPQTTGTLGYEHDFLLPVGKLEAQANTKLSQGYWTTVNNRALAYAYQDGYTRSDASLTYDSGKRWLVSGWVKNIENKAQAQTAYPLNRLFISYPRTYGVNVNLNW